MPRSTYKFIDIDFVENVLTDLICDYFSDYDEPVPSYEYLDGIRGRGLLESALAEPRQTFDSKYLHRTVFDKAAALWRSVTLNHPFVNGNKRMGLLCCHIFLTINGYVLISPQTEAVEFCVNIARQDHGTSVSHIATWLRRNTLTMRQVLLLTRYAEDEPDYILMVGRAVNDLMQVTNSSYPPNS